MVTSLIGDARHPYDKRYCARGEAENRIKKAQLDLFGRRARPPSGPTPCTANSLDRTANVRSGPSAVLTL